MKGSAAAITEKASELKELVIDLEVKAVVQEPSYLYLTQMAKDLFVILWLSSLKVVAKHFDFYSTSS